MTTTEKREWLDGEVYALKLAGYVECHREGSKTYYHKSFLGKVWKVDSHTGIVKRDWETQVARIFVTLMLVAGVALLYHGFTY